jgi:hypothetical protein
VTSYSHPFPQDEYQACSGEAPVAAKRALTKKENAAGLKPASIYGVYGTTKVVP